MSSSSASQNMAQPNQLDESYDPSVTPKKRKRGRPRKEGRPRKAGVSGSEPIKRRKKCTVIRSRNSKDGLVGQEVSGCFIGVFDAGYLLTVQVGSSGPILTGLVFDPRLCVPVSAENDIAPHLPMLRRTGLSFPAEEGFINQGADSSQAGAEQNAELIKHIQARESPTTSSFTSPVQTDLQLNTMEVTPSQYSHVPQTTSDMMETQNVPKTSKVFLDAAATETSELNPLTSSYHPQSQPMCEHIPISARLSNASMEAPASRPSNGYNPPVLPIVASSEVFKPVPEALTNASDEHSNIPSEALSNTNEASLNDISKEAQSVVLESSEASAIAQKITFEEHKSSVVSASEATEILQLQTLKNGDLSVENLSSEKSSQRMEEASEDRKVDEALGDGCSPGGEE